MSNAVVLQSGFIARSNTLDKLTRNNSEIPNNIIMAIVKLGKNFLKDQTDFYFNVQLDELFYKLEQNRDVIKSFEFREIVIKQVYDCFGRDKSTSIIDWVKLQANAPLMTEGHLIFLDAFVKMITNPLIVNYEYNGGFRDEIKNGLSMNTFEHLVVPAQIENKLVLENIKKYDALRNVILNNGYKTLTNGEAIANALSGPDHFFNLLYACKIIFGNQRSKRVYY